MNIRPQTHVQNQNTSFPKIINIFSLKQKSLIK